MMLVGYARKRLLLLVLSGLAAVTAAWADDAGEIFAAKDLAQVKDIRDVSVSPDGSKVAYTLMSLAEGATEVTSSIWLLEVKQKAGSPRRLTEEGSFERLPSWSPDGKSVYFVSARSGSKQVWMMPAEGGPASQVTQLLLDVTSFRLSPRMDRIFVAMDVYRHCIDLGCSAALLNGQPGGTQRQSTLYKQLFSRHGRDWRDGRRSQLFSVALARGRQAGTPIKLSIDIEGDVPRKPDGDNTDYAVSGDGAAVIFAEQREAAREAWSTQFHLFRVLSSGGERKPNGAPGKDADPVDLLSGTRPLLSYLSLSPSGKELAFLAADRAGYGADRRHIELLDLQANSTGSLAPDWDCSVRKLAWTLDGKTLIVLADFQGQRPLWAINVGNGKITRLTQEGTVADFAVSADRIWYVSSSLAAPPELYSVSLAGGRGPVQLTHLNEQLVAHRALGEYQQLGFEGSYHEPVRGFLVKPAKFNPDKKYPLAVFVHDGPHETMGNEWNSHWNAQAFAAAGLAVLMVDYHGSSGYGQKFTDSTAGDWATGPIQDIQAAVDFVDRHNPWLVAGRSCVVGAGFGAYLVNLIAGLSPDAHRCLVSHAGWLDNRSFYYSTDELWMPEWELGGPEYEKPAAYAANNPVDHVGSWHAAILFSHGERDYRVAIDESQKAFAAAARRQIAAQLLRYPNEGHVISNPAAAVDWHEQVIRFVLSSTHYY